MCGDGNITECSSENCKDECRLLRGGLSANSMMTGEGGILSIRNVNFN